MDQPCGIGREDRRYCILNDEVGELARLLNLNDGSKRIAPESIRAMLLSKTRCTDEECMIGRLIGMANGTQYEAIVLRIKEIAFKVEGPVEIDALLDNFLLIRMGRQVSANYSGIKFGGVLTYDFMTLPYLSSYALPSKVFEDWKTTSWNQLHFILNVDHRMGTGQHWVGLVIRLEGAVAELLYFDSYGSVPISGYVQGSRSYVGITDSSGLFLSRLDVWVRDVRRAFIKNGVSMTLHYGHTCHQERKDKSNCGVYAMVFLREMGKRIPFREFDSKRISMVEIEKQRSILYKRTDGYEPTIPI